MPSLIPSVSVSENIDKIILLRALAGMSIRALYADQQPDGNIVPNRWNIVGYIRRQYQQHHRHGERIFSRLVLNIMQQYEQSPRPSLQISLNGHPVSLQQQNNLLLISWKGKTVPLPDMTIKKFVDRLRLDRYINFHYYGLSEAEQKNLSKDFTDCDFSNQKFHGINCFRLKFYNINFAGSDLNGACFDHVHCRLGNFEKSNLSKAQFQHSSFTWSNFQGAILTNANFNHALLAEIDFSGADLRHATFEKSNLHKVNFTGADLRGVNFLGAGFVDVLFHNAIFNKATRFSARILMSTGDNLNGLDLASVSIVMPSEWNFETLDYYLNPNRNEGVNLITVIDRLADDNPAKLELMRQLIQSLNSVSEDLLQPFLGNFLSCLKPPYTQDAAISSFLENRVIPSIISASNTRRLKIQNAADCRELLSFIDEEYRSNTADPDAFKNFVMRNNGFFIQLILNSQLSGDAKVEDAANSLYADYLKLGRIRPYTLIDDAFGNGEGEVDWHDKYALNYLLVTDRNTDAGREERTLLLSKDQLTAMLKGTPENWSSYYLYLRAGKAENPSNQNSISGVRTLFQEHFRLFLSPYLSTTILPRLIRLIEALNLSQEHKELFVDALRQELGSDRKLTEPQDQQALNEVFSVLLQGADQGIAELQITKAHYDKLIEIFALTEDTNSVRAQYFLCFSAIFAKYSSSKIFGVEEDSPGAVRSYAYALLNTARELDANVIDKKSFLNWQERFLGRGLDPTMDDITCTDALTERMFRYAQQNFPSITEMVFPVAWTRKNIGHQGAEAYQDQNVIAANNHLGTDEKADNKDVNRFSRPLRERLAQEILGTDYDRQLIIQLEDDDTVRNAAQSLAEKHPGISTLVQMDAQGNYRVVKRGADGEWMRLSAEDSRRVLRQEMSAAGRVRWQLVGHGRNAAGQTGKGNNVSIGGQTVEQLAPNLQALATDIRRNPDHMSHVGCTLTTETDPLSSVPGELMKRLPEVNSSSARTENVEIIDGRKVTHDTDTGERRKVKTILFLRKPDGSTYAQVKVRPAQATAPEGETALLSELAPAINTWVRRKILAVQRIVKRLKEGAMLPGDLDADDRTLLADCLEDSDRAIQDVALRNEEGLRIQQAVEALLRLPGDALQDISATLKRQLSPLHAGWHSLAEELQLLPDSQADMQAGDRVLQAATRAGARLSDSLNRYQVAAMGLQARIVHALQKRVETLNKGVVMPAGMVMNLAGIEANQRLLASGEADEKAREEAKTAIRIGAAEMFIDGADLLNDLLSPSVSIVRQLSNPSGFRTLAAAMKSWDAFRQSAGAGKAVLGYLGKAAGPLLGFAGAGFAWYHPHQSMQALDDAEKQAGEDGRDLSEALGQLRMSAVLAIAGAVVSTLSASAALAALAGIAAATGAGLPLALLGMALFMLASIQGAATTVAEYRKYIELTHSETFWTGFSAVLGDDFTLALGGGRAMADTERRKQLALVMDHLHSAQLRGDIALADTFATLKAIYTSPVSAEAPVFTFGNQGKETRRDARPAWQPLDVDQRRPDAALPAEIKARALLSAASGPDEKRRQQQNYRHDTHLSFWNGEQEIYLDKSWNKPGYSLTVLGHIYGKSNLKSSTQAPLPAGARPRVSGRRGVLVQTDRAAAISPSVAPQEGIAEIINVTLYPSLRVIGQKSLEIKIRDASRNTLSSMAIDVPRHNELLGFEKISGTAENGYDQFLVLLSDRLLLVSGSPSGPEVMRYHYDDSLVALRQLLQQSLHARLIRHGDYVVASGVQRDGAVVTLKYHSADMAFIRKTQTPASEVRAGLLQQPDVVDGGILFHDINGDGLDDLIIVCHDGEDNARVRVTLQQQDGQFPAEDDRWDFYRGPSQEKLSFREHRISGFTDYRRTLLSTGPDGRWYAHRLLTQQEAESRLTLVTMKDGPGEADRFTAASSSDYWFEVDSGIRQKIVQGSEGQDTLVLRGGLARAAAITVDLQAGKDKLDLSAAFSRDNQGLRVSLQEGRLQPVTGLHPFPAAARLLSQERVLSGAKSLLEQARILSQARDDESLRSLDTATLQQILKTAYASHTALSDRLTREAEFIRAEYIVALVELVRGLQELRAMESAPAHWSQLPSGILEYLNRHTNDDRIKRGLQANPDMLKKLHQALRDGKTFSGQGIADNWPEHLAARAVELFKGIQASPLTWELLAGIADSFMCSQQHSLRGIEEVTGTLYDDVIEGTDEDNGLNSNGGSDEIKGLKGRDTLSGGESSLLAGGEDNDTYVVQRVSEKTLNLRIEEARDEHSVVMLPFNAAEISMLRREQGRLVMSFTDGGKLSLSESHYDFILRDGVRFSLPAGGQLDDIKASWSPELDNSLAQTWKNQQVSIVRVARRRGSLVLTLQVDGHPVTATHALPRFSGYHWKITRSTKERFMAQRWRMTMWFTNSPADPDIRYASLNLMPKPA